MVVLDGFGRVGYELILEGRNGLDWAWLSQAIDLFHPRDHKRDNVNSAAMLDRLDLINLHDAYGLLHTCPDLLRSWRMLLRSLRSFNI